MFNFGKKANEQVNTLQELNEEQLLQVAGGSDCYKSSYNDHDADDKKWSKHKHHHHHHHHDYDMTWKNDHDADDKKWTSSTTSYSGGHW